jgi:hypothetical protein
MKAVCAVCGTEYGELADHVYGTAYKYDTSHHWNECACGAESTHISHVFGEWTEKDGVESATCTCGYTAKAITVKDTASAYVATAAIFGGVCGIGGIGIAVFLLLKKKKNV